MKEYQTIQFNIKKEIEKEEIKKTLKKVYLALEEKGYNALAQIMGYLVTGDPAYIPRYKDCRNMLKRIERDKIIIELLSFYIKDN